MVTVGSGGSNCLRGFVTLLGLLVPIAPCFASGCGTSATAAPGSVTDGAVEITTDGSVRLVTVVTAGGGAAPSSRGAVVDPFGSSSSSGSSSGGSSNGGSSSGNESSSGTPDSGSSDASQAGSSSGIAPDSGASSGTSSSSGSSSGDASPSVCDNYTPPVCGTQPCDLRSNTCCISLTLQARCIAGANTACSKNEAAIHCLYACECAGGEVCCGVDDTLVGVVQTGCQAVANGGSCNPHPQTATQASAQLCKQTAECKNGESCIAQTCVYGAMLNICGLQSQAPFNCH